MFNLLEEGVVMRCPKCGRELQDNWIKCPYCNTDILKNQEEKIPDKKQKEKVSKVQNNYLFQAWKMAKKILKIVIYIFVALLLLMGPLMSSGMGTTTDSFIEVASYYIYILFLVIIPLILILNFKGIRNRLPLFKKHHIGTTIIAYILTYFSICIILIGTAILSDSLYSQEYKDEKKIQQIAEEEARIVAEKEAAEKEAAEKEAAEKEAAEKKAAEKEAAEKEAAEKEAAEKEAAEKEAAEKEAAEKEAAEKRQKKEAEQENAGSTYPYLSRNYLNYYLEQAGISVPLFAQETVVNTYLESCNTISYQNLSIGGLFSHYYQIVDGETNYIYFGESKNGRPDGLGVIKQKLLDVSDDPNYISLREYDGKEEEADGTCYYATVYAGYFSNGKYEGFGMLYRTPLDEDYLNSGIYLENFYQEYVKNDVQKSILMTINPLYYEGGFSEGEYADNGYEFYYTAVNDAYTADELEQTKADSILICTYEDGKAKEFVSTKGSMEAFDNWHD